MLVLGIESTCDETACAIVRSGQEILANMVSSQVDMHAEYGGVVPELACRRHVDILIPIVQQALLAANVSLNDIDLIAVAKGPGLIGALLIGLNAAKTLALALNKPFVGVNHIEAHLYASLMSQQTDIEFPCLGAVLSGGHTSLVLMHGIGNYQLISQTVDDAIGEAFDKVAKILDLPYPGGPQIENLATQGNPFLYPFKPGKVKGSPLDFSFSGLKTAVLYTVKGQNLKNPTPLSTTAKCDISASFQHTAFSDVINKTVNAAQMHQCNTLILGGGVSNNQKLRQMFSEAAPSLKILWPNPGLSLDNAAMIAGLGYHCYQRIGCGDSLDVEALTRIPF